MFEQITGWCTLMTGTVLRIIINFRMYVQFWLIIKWSLYNIYSTFTFIYLLSCELEKYIYIYIYIYGSCRKGRFYFIIKCYSDATLISLNEN